MISYQALSMLNTINSSSIHLNKYINNRANAYKYIKADYNIN